MSSRSISVPGKISDAQFIGDLMNLFERRKVPVGDTASFQTFESELASNDLLRSGLFTLCTAISHMAEADLSGEQLLALVARALAGPAIAKGAAIEIPDGMRSAFLKGYDAWSNRDFDIKEPLAWPAPRPARREDIPTTSPQPDAATEPVAVRPRTPGIHTVQEALEIAKKRFPAEPALPHPADMGAKVANIEGLTLSELKALLEDIERRVTRIQPQVRELDSMGRPPAADFGRHETMHEIDEVAPEPSGTSHRSPSSSKLNEAAFLARHAYLSPTRRVLPHVQVTGGLARPIAAPTPAAIPAAAAPAPFVAVTPAPFVVAAPVAVPSAIPEPVAVPAQLAEDGRAVRFEPAVIPIAVPDLPQHSAEDFRPLTEVRAAMAAAQPIQVPGDPRIGSIYFRIGSWRFGPRTVLGSLVAFIIIAGGLGGVLIYPSLHPYYFYSDSGLQPPGSASTAQGPARVSDSASAAQIILTAPDNQSVIAQPKQSAHVGNSAGSKAHAKDSPAPPVSVWPATGAAAAIAMPAVSASASPATRWSASPSRPVYVPSTTIIGYAVSAPQPIYPSDQPKGIIGTVVLQVTISTQGEVTDIRTLSGPVEMRPATVQAVQSWRFKPYLVNGSPVEVSTTLGFLFRGQ